MEHKVTESAWENLPVELWGIIFAKLDTRSLVSVALSNKKIYESLDRSSKALQKQLKCWDLGFLGLPALESSLSTYRRRLQQDGRISEMITEVAATGEGLENLVAYVAEVGDEAISVLLCEQNDFQEALFWETNGLAEFRTKVEESWPSLYQRVSVRRMSRLTRSAIADRLLDILRYKKLADAMVGFARSLDFSSPLDYFLMLCLRDRNYFQLMRQRHMVLVDTARRYSDIAQKSGSLGLGAKIRVMIDVFQSMFAGSNNDRHDHHRGLTSFLWYYDQVNRKAPKQDFEWLLLCCDMFTHLGLECNIVQETRKSGLTVLRGLRVSNGEETCEVTWSASKGFEVKPLVLKRSLIGFITSYLKKTQDTDLIESLMSSFSMVLITFCPNGSDSLGRCWYGWFPHLPRAQEIILGVIAPHLESAYPHYMCQMFENVKMFVDGSFCRKPYDGTYDELFFCSFTKNVDEDVKVPSGRYRTGDLVNISWSRLIFCVLFETPVPNSYWVSDFRNHVQALYISDVDDPEERMETHLNPENHGLLGYAWSSHTGHRFEYLDWDNRRFVPNKFFLKWMEGHSPES